jgi:hypothetical protein
MRRDSREASWTAPVLWRFERSVVCIYVSRSTTHGFTGYLICLKNFVSHLLRSDIAGTRKMESHPGRQTHAERVKITQSLANYRRIIAVFNEKSSGTERAL